MPTPYDDVRNPDTALPRCYECGETDTEGSWIMVDGWPNAEWRFYCKEHIPEVNDARD